MSQLRDRQYDYKSGKEAQERRGAYSGTLKIQAKSINRKERKVKNTQRAQREFFALFVPSL